MTDEMDRMSDDRWLPESDGDATHTGDGDFPSFEEALRAHGFEVEPPQLTDDPGLVGPEFDEDEELAVDDDSTAPILPDATVGKPAIGSSAGTESPLAALAASWIPRSSVASRPVQPRGSVFGTVLTRPSAVSAPWVTAPGPVAAPDLEDSALAEDARVSEVQAQISEPTEADEAGEVEEPTLLDALAALDEAPAWTAGEAGVVEMSTTEVTEAWDLLVTSESDAPAAGPGADLEPADLLEHRRKARRRRKDNAAAAKATAAADAAVTPDASSTEGPARATADEVEDHWWIEPGATPEDTGPRLPQAPASLAEPRPPVPSASLFAGHLTSAPAGTSEAAPAEGTAERIAGAEFVGYDAAAAARAAAAAEARAQPSAEPEQEVAQPEQEVAQPEQEVTEPETVPGPAPAREAPLDDFEARLRAATEPLGYMAPSEASELESPEVEAGEWAPSAAAWEELHDDPWAAQAATDRVASAHEREPYVYEAPTAPPPEPEAPAADLAVETQIEPAPATESSAASPELDLTAEPVTAPPVAATPDDQAAETDSAIARTARAPAQPSLPPTPRSLRRSRGTAASGESGVLEATAALATTSVGVDAQAAGAASSAVEERGDLWHLVSDKANARATAPPTAPDRVTIFLTVLVAIVIVLLVLGFIALFTNFFH